MDEKTFKERSSRLRQVAKVLENLPAEVRSEAFDLLKEYVSGQPKENREREGKAEERQESSGKSEEEFFAAFEHDKPADNAKLIAAWFYQEFGVEPFSVDEVRVKAVDVGITIPARLDMTFLSAKEKGKNLFTRAGQGKFRPTVHGEANLKATYSIKRGTKRREGTAS